MCDRDKSSCTLTQVHDTVHNITRGDIKYGNGVMVVIVRWSKTDQLGEDPVPMPMIADNTSLFCQVRWILYMVNRIPAQAHNNLFVTAQKRIGPSHLQGPRGTHEKWVGWLKKNSRIVVKPEHDTMMGHDTPEWAKCDVPPQQQEFGTASEKPAATVQMPMKKEMVISSLNTTIIGDYSVSVFPEFETSG